jgi:hypothetical protein
MDLCLPWFGAVYTGILARHAPHDATFTEADVVLNILPSSAASAAIAVMSGLESCFAKTPDRPFGSLRCKH